jgi:hypothetical protein
MDSVTIELVMGYQSRALRDGEPEVHRRVTFGKRLKGRSLFNIDSDPQSKLSTQYQDLIVRDCITEFGTIKMPVPLQFLLELDSIDRDDLADAHQKFMRGSLVDWLAERGLKEGDAPAVIDDAHVRLAYGYEHNGVCYDLVEFGHRLTGMSEVKADKQKLTGVRRTCFLAGLQIARLMQTTGASEISGPIDPYTLDPDMAPVYADVFAKLDAIDIQAIQMGSVAYRESFRVGGKGVPKKRTVN